MYASSRIYHPLTTTLCGWGNTEALFMTTGNTTSTNRTTAL